MRTLLRLVEVSPFLAGGVPAGIVAAATKTHQRLGDLAAGTFVIRAKDRSAAQRLLNVCPRRTSRRKEARPMGCSRGLSWPVLGSWLPSSVCHCFRHTWSTPTQGTPRICRALRINLRYRRRLHRNRWFGVRSQQLGVGGQLSAAADFERRRKARLPHHYKTIVYPSVRRSGIRSRYTCPSV